MEEIERRNESRPIASSVERLERDINSCDEAADGLKIACRLLGYSLDPRDKSGDHAIDVALGFIRRVSEFLRLTKKS